MLLSELGPRICILGPSNSGKSTLAVAIAQKLDLPAIHLDQLFHLPNTNWVQRPAAEFVQMHNAAIAQANWVIEGNYSKVIPQRLAAATGVIKLNATTGKSLLRYFRRSLFEHNRPGALEGGKDSIKWAMIHHIAIRLPRGRQRNQAVFDALDLPKINVPTMAHLNNLYKQWNL